MTATSTILMMSQRSYARQSVVHKSSNKGCFPVVLIGSFGVQKISHSHMQNNSRDTVPATPVPQQQQEEVA